jgi:hypothetical protein
MNRYRSESKIKQGNKHDNIPSYFCNVGDFSRDFHLNWSLGRKRKTANFNQIGSYLVDFVVFCWICSFTFELHEVSLIVQSIDTTPDSIGPKNNTSK